MRAHDFGALWVARNGVTILVCITLRLEEAHELRKTLQARATAGNLSWVYVSGPITDDPSREVEHQDEMIAAAAEPA